MKLEPLIADWYARKTAAELALVHLGELGAHEQATELASESLGKGRPEPGELARRLERVASADAESRGGRQRYRVTLYRRGGKALDSHPFSIDGGDRDEMGGDGRAAVKHSTRMAVRMHELMAKFSESGFGALLNMNKQLIESMDELRSMVNGQFVTQAKLISELMDRSAEQKLETQIAASREARQDRLLEQGEKVVPHLIAQLTGSSALMDLWNKIPQDKAKIFLDSLSDDELAPLFDAMRLNKQARESMAELLGKKAEQAEETDDA